MLAARRLEVPVASPVVSAVPRIAIPSADPTCRDGALDPGAFPDCGGRDIGEDHARQLCGGEANAEPVDEQLRAELPGGPVGREGEADGDDADDLEREPELNDLGAAPTDG